MTEDLTRHRAEARRIALFFFICTPNSGVGWIFARACCQNVENVYKNAKFEKYAKYNKILVNPPRGSRNQNMYTMYACPHCVHVYIA